MELNVENSSSSRWRTREASNGDGEEDLISYTITIIIKLQSANFLLIFISGVTLFNDIFAARVKLKGSYRCKNTQDQHKLTKMQYYR